MQSWYRFLTSSAIAVSLGVGAAVAKPVFRKPPPEGVVEIIGVAGSGSSLAELKDGTLIAAKGGGYRLSKDGGRTWGGPQSFPQGVSVNGILRLDNGDLAVMHTTASGGNLNNDWLAAELRFSSDDGATWGDPLPVKMMGTPYYDALVQLASGRLVYPSRVCFGNPMHPDVGYRGHSTYPELDIAAVSHSDDLGKTWYVGAKKPPLGWGLGQYGSSVLMGWFGPDGEPNGQLGITACDEPSVAETKDGRVLFFGRSAVGRLIYSYSSDGGETWTAVRPTPLVSCYSPCRLRRVPSTGDLICVWNQVSPEENEYGWRRRRLSAAISRDSGKTWVNFRTLELSAGLEDVARIEPKLPIYWVRAGSQSKPLPEDAALFSYPNVRFAKDSVFIMYNRQWLEAGKWVSEAVLRVYPVDYFYAE